MNKNQRPKSKIKATRTSLSAISGTVARDPLTEVQLQKLRVACGKVFPQTHVAEALATITQNLVFIELFAAQDLPGSRTSPVKEFLIRYRKARACIDDLINLKLGTDVHLRIEHTLLHSEESGTSPSVWAVFESDVAALARLRQTFEQKIQELQQVKAKPQPKRALQEAARLVARLQTRLCPDRPRNTNSDPCVKLLHLVVALANQFPPNSPGDPGLTTCRQALAVAMKEQNKAAAE